MGLTRREFLTATAAAAVTGCRLPLPKEYPSSRRPETLTPPTLTEIKSVFKAEEAQRISGTEIIVSKVEFPQEELSPEQKKIWGKITSLAGNNYDIAEFLPIEGEDKATLELITSQKNRLNIKINPTAIQIGSSSNQETTEFSFEEPTDSFLILDMSRENKEIEKKSKEILQREPEAIAPEVAVDESYLIIYLPAVQKPARSKRRMRALVLLGEAKQNILMQGDPDINKIFLHKNQVLISKERLPTKNLTSLSIVSLFRP